MATIKIDNDITTFQVIESLDEQQIINILPLHKATLYHKHNKKINHVIVTVEAGARLMYLLWQSDNQLNVKYDIYVKRDAEVRFITMTSTSDNVTLLPQIYLQEQGAKVEVMNVILAKDKSQVLCDSLIIHEKGNTISNHESYIIATNESQVKVNNNTKIQKGASLSNANQIAKGLNIGDQSHIIADPNLFIEEHDCFAHHGAAIGSLNKEEMFYLMSRGLTEENASKLIIMGFLQPLLDNISDEQTKNEIKEDFEHKLK